MRVCHPATIRASISSEPCRRTSRPRKPLSLHRLLSLSRRIDAIEIFARQNELEALRSSNPVAAGIAYAELDGGDRDLLRDLFGQNGPYEADPSDKWAPPALEHVNRPRELADAEQTLARYRDGVAHGSPWLSEKLYEKVSDSLDAIDSLLTGSDRDDEIMRTARTLALASLHSRGAQPFGRVVETDSFTDSRGRLHRIETSDLGRKRQRVWSRAETDALIAAQDARRQERKELGFGFDPSPAFQDALAGLAEGNLDVESIAKVTDPQEIMALWRKMGPEREKQLLRKASGSRG